MKRSPASRLYGPTDCYCDAGQSLRAVLGRLFGSLNTSPGSTAGGWRDDAAGQSPCPLLGALE